MPVKKRHKRIMSMIMALAMTLSMVSLTLVTVSASASTDTDHVIVNQVYGASDDGYASHSFIELYNPTDEEVDLSEWSIQYRSSKDGDDYTSWVKLDLTGTISANGYYLIRCASVTNKKNVSYEVPEGNQEWDLVIHNKGVSVALVNNQVQLGDDVLGNVVDNEDIIDLLAAAGNDYKASSGKNSDQLPLAWEGEDISNIDGIQSKKKSIRRSNFVDTNDSASDCTTVDYSKTVSDDDGPHVGSTTVDSGGDTSETETVITVVINEIESSGDDNDWVEIYNYGTEDIDISGWYILDNDPDHISETTPLAEGTTLKAGGYYVFEEDVNFYFGLGKEDSAILYDKDGKEIDSYSWTSHASGTYGRSPDGIGDFVDLSISTKGASNTSTVSSGDDTSSGTETVITVVINEIESSGDTTDWIEIYNYGTEDIDISGWYVVDNKASHKSETTPLAEGTTLKAGEYYVFEYDVDFYFGLGDEDSAILYDENDNEIDSYSWTSHASGTYGRIPNGTGDFVDLSISTKGAANQSCPVVINEIKADSDDNWIELVNTSSSEASLDGVSIKDGSGNSYAFEDGTTIAGNGYLVIYQDSLGFTLAESGSISLYEGDLEIDSVSWSAGDMNPTYGRYPNERGDSFETTSEETPGEENIFSDSPEVVAWQGSEETVVVDLTFLTDSSGLEFYNGQLYLIDNGTATFWIMDVAEDGTLTFADGYDESGKRIRFQKDADNSSAAGPDTEGITVDGEGYVYAAAERDNEDKNTNYNVILKVNPNEEGTDLVALMEWDITDLLPQVTANTGIEAVEWVSNDDMEGLLYDENYDAPYDSTKYPNATADGIFFVALEDNGHVYALVLNDDGTAVVIADIDTKLGMAMGLDYDTYENVLRVATDNGYSCRMAELTFNGTEDVDIVHVKANESLDTTQNYEGFAVADYSFTVDGKRPVYRCIDGVSSGALVIDYMVYDTEETEDTGSDTEEDTGSDTEEDTGSNTEEDTGSGTEGTDSDTEEETASGTSGTDASGSDTSTGSSTSSTSTSSGTASGTSGTTSTSTSSGTTSSSSGTTSTSTSSGTTSGTSGTTSSSASDETSSTTEEITDSDSEESTDTDTQEPADSLTDTDTGEKADSDIVTGETAETEENNGNVIPYAVGLVIFIIGSIIYILFKRKKDEENN